MNFNCLECAIGFWVAAVPIKLPGLMSDKLALATEAILALWSESNFSRFAVPLIDFERIAVNARDCTSDVH